MSQRMLYILFYILICPSKIRYPTSWLEYPYKYSKLWEIKKLWDEVKYIFKTSCSIKAFTLITNDTRVTVSITTSSKVIFNYQTHQRINLFHICQKGCHFLILQVSTMSSSRIFNYWLGWKKHWTALA